MHLWKITLLLVALIGGWTPVAAAASNDALCFKQTGFCVAGRLRAFWEENGGLPVFGYPVGPVVAQMNQDAGRVVLTQWFERVRLELHPALPQPYDVLIGRLGAEVIAARPVPQVAEVGPRTGCLWFSQTGHNVCDSSAPFRQYWESHGLLDPKLDRMGRSLSLWGLPLTAPLMETNSSGDRVLVQWFERARFEWHPATANGPLVLIGRLGSDGAPSAGVLGTAGITGQTTAGPTCPVEQIDHPCHDRIVQATIKVYTSGTDQLITTATSGPDGVYVIPLAPGRVRLEPQRLGPGLFRVSPPVEATVEDGRFVEVNILYDTGIR